MKRIAAIFLSLCSIILLDASVARADLLGVRNARINMLRVHDVGTRYGPPSDQIDVEVVIQLVERPGNAFGFQLRNDANQLAREGMLDLLRDAFNNDLLVNIDYEIDPPKRNGTIIRVWVTK